MLKVKNWEVTRIGQYEVFYSAEDNIVRKVQDILEFKEHDVLPKKGEYSVLNVYTIKALRMMVIRGQIEWKKVMI